jgi:hypothetical protein
MATKSFDVISASILAGPDPTADAIPSPFTSLLSITDIAVNAAGILAGDVSVSAIAIDAVR